MLVSGKHFTKTLVKLWPLNMNVKLSCLHVLKASDALIPDQGSGSVFVKGLIENTLGFEEHMVSVPATQLCGCHAKAVEDNMLNKYNMNCVYKSRPRARFGMHAIGSGHLVEVIKFSNCILVGLQLQRGELEFSCIPR